LGSTRWAYREGEGLNEYGLSVSAFDSTVFLTGFYRDSVFNLLPFNLTNAFKGNQDLFVAALLQPSALPIELISLNASGVGSEVMLNWTTTQENNSDYFQLERSSDSREFDLVAKINAAGFSSTLTHYDFTDETPVIGYNYYRLCLFDLDGRKTYYGPVAVRIFKSGIDGVRVQLFANPDQLTIDIEGLIESFRIRIFDSAGKEIFHENDQCPSGSCRHSYETGILTQGIYVCLLESKSGIVACQRFSVRY
jgi:hypothetical protein